MFQESIAQVISEHTNLEEKKILDVLEIPPDDSLGDYAFPCFILAKELKKAPATIAQELAEKARADFLLRVEAKGPYCNFFVKESAWASNLESFTSNLWKQNPTQQTVLIEYPSPNTNKPLHLGHVRNMILGSTIKSLFSLRGHRVIQVNLNNDRGVHICKSMLAYKLWGDNKEPDKKSDHFVGDWYIRFAKEAQKDPSLVEKAQEMLRLWEAGDEGVVKLWKQMNDWAYDGWAETFRRFNISFDKEYYESEVYSDGKKIVLNNKELFSKEDGAIVAYLDEYKLPKKVLLRKDGTAIYMTQDLALTLKKEEEFSPNHQVWIVGNEQELHFKQLFAILDKLGHSRDSFFHLSYGMIELPSGKMKSREGSVVDADDLLDEMELLAQKSIRERREDWSQNKIEETARHVAMAAIRFFIIKYDPVKNFVFNPESSLSFEGDTGPYLQYTHARISRILEKTSGVKRCSLDVLGNEEVPVCKAISELQQAFIKSSETYKPHLVAQQLLVLGRAINTYYHSTHILQTKNKGVQDARVYFLSLVQKALKEGLEVLGIRALKEM